MPDLHTYLKFIQELNLRKNEIPALNLKIILELKF